MHFRPGNIKLVQELTALCYALAPLAPLAFRCISFRGTGESDVVLITSTFVSAKAADNSAVDITD